MRLQPELYSDIPAVQAMRDNTYHSKVVPHLEYIRAQLALGRPTTGISLELGLEATTVWAFRKRNPHLFT